jgi:hypothetical protein
MLLQMIGFLFFLVFVGGLTTLVAIADPHHATLTRYIGFMFLLAGVGGLILSLGMDWASTLLFSTDGLGFFVGYGVGGGGGAALGFYLARGRKARTRDNNTKATLA